MDADGDVISFPPITNSEKTKVGQSLCMSLCLGLFHLLSEHSIYSIMTYILSACLRCSPRALVAHRLPVSGVAVPVICGAIPCVTACAFQPLPQLGKGTVLVCRAPFYRFLLRTLVDVFSNFILL